MSQRFHNCFSALQSVSTLLVLAVLALSWPVAAQGQEELSNRLLISRTSGFTASDAANEPTLAPPVAGVAGPASANAHPSKTTANVAEPTLKDAPMPAATKPLAPKTVAKAIPATLTPTEPAVLAAIPPKAEYKTTPRGVITSEPVALVPLASKPEVAPIQMARSAFPQAVPMQLPSRMEAKAVDTSVAAVQPAATPSTTVSNESGGLAGLIAEIVEPQNEMKLDLYRSKLIRTKAPVTRFSITDPKALDLVQYSPTEFELIGLQAGQTSLTIWFGDNRALRYQVTVSAGVSGRAAAEYRELERKLHEMFPNSSVQLIPFADKLIVRGQAKDSSEAAQILSVLTGGRGQNVGQNQGTGYANVGNRLNLGPAATPNPGGPELPPHNIINLLTVPGEQQVMLKVRIAELSRSALRQMQVQLKINNGNLALDTSSGGISAVFKSVLNPEDLRLALTAVNGTSYTKILAEPNLVTLNGQSADFLAGGEFPVPTAVGVGGISGFNTQFHRFGTQLTFTPTIVDQDRVRLSVSPSFSTINQSVSVQGIPGTNSRSVTTTVDLRVGQWLAIGGLLQDEQQGSKTRVPFVGDIPVVGTLFGKNSSERDETELIILVSPELVHPMDAREAPLILPGMDIAEPDDEALFLGGAYVATPDSKRHSTRPAASQPDAAKAKCRAVHDAMSRPDYQRSEKYYIYGPHGTSQ